MNLNLSKMNMSKSLGIDLGTSNTLIYLAGKGIVLQEPSVAAVNSRSMQVLEVGDAAGLMVGKTAGELLAFRPIKDGVIADFDVTVAMLGKFIRKVTGPILFNRPKVAVCVPLGLTGVEISQTAADLISFAFSIPLQASLLKEMTREERFWKN